MASNDKVVEVPLTQIDLSFENARFGDWENETGVDPETASDFADLVLSIATKGQDVAVDVRPKGNKFQLITGFRRYAALNILSDKGKLEKFIAALEEHKHEDQAELLKKNLDGHKAVTVIRAQVKDYLNEYEVVALNARENTARQNLRGADLAYAVHRMQVLAAENRKVSPDKITSVELAAELGKNQPYIAKLMRIMNVIKPSITKHWREKAQVRISIEQMLKVTEATKDRQQEVYEAYFKKAEEGEDKKGGKSRWINTAKKKATAVAILLANLEKRGLINTDNLDFSEHIDLCVKIKKNATNGQRKQIASVAQKAYDTAFDAPVEPEESEEDE